MLINRPEAKALQLDRCEVCGNKTHRSNLVRTQVEFLRVKSENYFTYSYYDGSYANRRSYGFWADVGNGWNTLLPSIFFLVGMTAVMVPPLVLGIVGLIIFYQKFYCTTLYFIAYVFNRRYAGRPMAWVIAIVGGTNGLWILFPGIGLYVCLRLIFENSYALLLS